MSRDTAKNRLVFPLAEALKNQFAGPSKEMIDTIIVAQIQVKDGFLSLGEW